MVHSASNHPPSRSGEGMLVVIDPGVASCHRLAKEVVPGAKVLVLDIAQDAIAQITDAFSKVSLPFSSLHIVVSGAPGVLRFASGDLSLKTLKSHVGRLQSWFGTDPELPNAPKILDPKIFIYGNSVGAQQAGVELVDTLTWLTGATVIAATTPINKGYWRLDDQAPEELPFTPVAQNRYAP